MIVFQRSKVFYQRMLNIWKMTKSTVIVATEREALQRTIATNQRDNSAQRNSLKYVQLIGPQLCHPFYVGQVDAGWITEGQATIGWVISDEDNHILKHEGLRIYSQSPMQAELMAIKYCLECALKFHLWHLEIQTDCLQAVLQLGDNGPIHHYSIVVLTEIRKLLLCFHCCCIRFIPRKLNRAAHQMAQKAKNM